jgi:hypothetical protein
MSPHPNSRYQEGLDRFTGCWWLPTGTASGSGMGAQWAGEGTFTAVAPATGGLAQQLKVGKYANLAAQTPHGVRATDPSDLQFWAGNAAGAGGSLGGYFFSALFRIEAWNADSGRLFVGMSSSTTAQANADIWTATDGIALWHDTTMGTGVLKLASRNNGAALATQDFTGFTLGPGSAFRFEMSQPQNLQGAGESAQVFCVLTSVGVGPSSRQILIANTAYRNTIFMAPQVQMSSGADATGGHFALGVASVYAHNY